MDEPIPEEFRQKMNDLAADLDHYFNGNERPRRLLFSLVVAKADDLDEGRVNYISNADRPSMVAALKGLLARWEGESK